MNRAQKRALAKMQVGHAKQLTHERQQIIREEKAEYLRQPFYKRLLTFYELIPTKKAKVVFWLWSPVIFGIFLPIQAVVALTKVDIAWKWTNQILYSFLNGK